MSLKARMTAGFTIMLATLAIVAGIGLKGLSSTQDQFERLVWRPSRTGSGARRHRQADGR